MNNLPDKQGVSGNGRDPSTGRFLSGFTGNPAGRPKALDLRAIAEKKAKENGVDLEVALWEVVVGLLERARAGDAAASKVVLDRLCGPLDRGPLVGVQVNNNDVIHPELVDANNPRGAPGPPVPEGPALAKWLLEYAEVGVQLHEQMPDMGWNEDPYYAVGMEVRRLREGGADEPMGDVDPNGSAEELHTGGAP